MSAKALGQYFTTSTMLQTYVYDLVANKGAPLLEPSVGAGHLLKPFLAANPAYPFTAFEIDTSVEPVITLTAPAQQKITYTNFMTTDPPTFRTIIGNPPFVKQRGKPNLYIQFIRKCFSLLDTTAPGAELVFIVPSDFIKLTSAARLIKEMIAVGGFTHFLFPHDEGLFADAAVDVMVFRYEYGADPNTTQVNGILQRLICSDGIVTFAEAAATDTATAELNRIADFFDVYVGIVSGRDEIYRQPFGDTDILIDEGKTERFILPRAFPTGNAQIDAHLTSHKAELMGRRIRKFSEKNWFEWGALRNVTPITEALGRPCIYIRTMTRKAAVAFEGTVQFFGGNLICLVPKTSVPSTDIAPLIERTLISIQAARESYVYAGRYKIGHKQISQLVIS